MKILRKRKFFSWTPCPKFLKNWMIQNLGHSLSSMVFNQEFMYVLTTLFFLFTPLGFIPAAATNLLGSTPQGPVPVSPPDSSLRLKSNHDMWITIEMFVLYWMSNISNVRTKMQMSKCPILQNILRSLCLWKLSFKCVGVKV